ncbi:MAG TPA: hypothetical protein VMX17_16140 [Candidatus Glassbacteria bacterium]|nr:hypothetical protein [Candidatus Glassbacteria bacterium]
MKVSGDIRKTEKLSQIGIIADESFESGEWDSQRDRCIGTTKDNRLITASIKTDRNGFLLYFNIIETKL